MVIVAIFDVNNVKYVTVRTRNAAHTMTYQEYKEIKEMEKDKLLKEKCV